MLHDYAVRITHDQATIRRIISVWSTRCLQIIAYEHVGDQTQKVHSHLLIKGSSIEKKQLRNIAQSIGVNLKGNENCSFKAFDENTKYLTYMSKGKIDPWYIQNFTTEEISEAKSQWIEPTEYIKPSSNEYLFNEFEKFLLVGSEDQSDVFSTSLYKEFLQKHYNSMENKNDPRFEFIKKKAHWFAFNKNRQLATPKFFNEYKLIVCTFCFREGISFPKDNSHWSRYN